MCGITGIIDTKGKDIDRALLKAMCNEMVHRGPDDEGYYFENRSGISVGLGHRRLSIIDLKTGHQPIHNETRDVWVIYNGEIYNFKELRVSLEKKGHRFYTNSDTEVIAHAYEEYGEDIVNYLRGMFAFSIWDSRNKKLILARDRIGKKPLLYAHLNNKLIFASEFKAILKSPDIDKEIDFEAIHHYLTYLCVPAPFTAFSKIKKLPPGHILVYQNDSIKLREYWTLDFSKKLNLTKSEAINEISKCIKDCVNARLVSDVPLGVLLSGGIDSSCITAMMHKLEVPEIKSFSIGFNESKYNELPYAEAIANQFSTNHVKEYVTSDTTETLPKLVEHYGEPFADSSSLPTYYVCSVASKYVKVALNGDGGDEAFGGYRRHLAFFLAEKFQKVSKIVNRSPIKTFFNMFPDKPSRPHSLGSVRRFLDSAELKRIDRYMRLIGFFLEQSKSDLYTDSFKNKTKGFNSLSLLERFIPKIEGLDAVDAALHLDTFFNLQNDLLVKMDIASMANSLETRSPLLDPKLLELLASLPSDYKIHNFELKHILKKTLEKMLPSGILKRPKMGFGVPVNDWFRGDLKSYIREILLSSRAINREYFEPNALKNIIELHLSKKMDYGQHLWGLLVLELWHRRFID